MKVKCHECEQEVSMASGRTIDGHEVDLCGVCDGQVEPCQCGSHDVVFSDFGVNLCSPCKKDSTPEQKEWLREQAYRDDLESGRI